ncbi:MAG: imidazole glycerol phosphate synthase subunit HisF [Bacteroidetes bacterium]|nr:imidazole glycerol phosphate synthase subunit HisF [Bacteroidota bacterium]
MLKKRIVATLVVKNNIVVQSIGFSKFLPVGKPDIAVEFLNQWGVDEIIFLDIDATKYKRLPNYSLIKKISRKCQVPLTVGGGIKDINHIKELMHCGADKVSLNNSAINNSELISEAATVFGNQCVVASIDATYINNQYKVYDYTSKKIIDRLPADFAVDMERAGAGEILINSVDRDGCYTGFDLNLINSVCNAVRVPVICSGGAKNAIDFVEVFQKTNVSAAAAANFFHFSEHSVITSKAFVSNRLPIRIETQATYHSSSFDLDLRLQKKNDDALEKLLFTKIEKELI